jgi:hypothetical protein
MDHSCSDDGPPRTALRDVHGPGRESCRKVGSPQTPVDVGATMSYLAQNCPDCGGLYIWDDDLGRFHEATGEEFCPAPESLQIGLPGELQEVADPALLRRSHSEPENGTPIIPIDLLGFRARRNLAPDRATGEED